MNLNTLCSAVNNLTNSINKLNENFKKFNLIKKLKHPKSKYHK